MDALKVPSVRALSSATAFQDAVEACKVRGCGEVDGEPRAGDGYGEFAASSWCDELFFQEGLPEAVYINK